MGGESGGEKKELGGGGCPLWVNRLTGRPKNREMAGGGGFVGPEESYQGGGLGGSTNFRSRAGPSQKEELGRLLGAGNNESKTISLY